MEKDHYITPDQLCIGLYIHLDMGWMSHSFTFSSFKIKNVVQLEKVRQLGLDRIRYDPKRSDCIPIKAADDAENSEAVPASQEIVNHSSPPPDAVAVMPVTTISREDQLRQNVIECEKLFNTAAIKVREIEKDALTKPEFGIATAETLVGEMSESILSEGDIAIHSIQPRGAGPGNVEHVHALNVTVISMIMARSMEISESDIMVLGKAAIFHDIGKKKGTPLPTGNAGLLTSVPDDGHSEAGWRCANNIGLGDRVGNIILQHHECEDGSGVPRGLSNGDIDPLAKIIFVANLFDNLCNTKTADGLMTPYQALSFIFRRAKQKCDEHVVNVLIKTFGIYPPGSIVQLSNGLHGVVLSVNPKHPLKPVVKVHDPKNAHADRAGIFDLSIADGISITDCLKRTQLPADAVGYLNPSVRISYFFNKNV